MRKFLLFLLLLLPCTTLAQTTTVTLQVTDASGQTWNNGTWTVNLVSLPGATPFGPPFFQQNTSTPVPNQSQSGTLSPTGSASIVLTQNAFISPSKSEWNFQVCGQTTATNNCFTQFVSITASTTVTLTPPALVVNPGFAAQAYTDSEIQSAIPGSLYYNMVSNTQRICNGPAPCTWTINSGGSGGNISDTSFGVIRDAQWCFYATVTSGTNTITCNQNGSAPFVPADVGKTAFMTCCIPFADSTAITSTVIVAETTITSYISSTQVTVGVNATGTAISGAYFVWGSNPAANDTALDNFWNAVAGTGGASSPSGVIGPCKLGVMGAGLALVHHGHFNESVCRAAITGAESAGLGLTGISSGTMTTGLIPTPNFDFGTCTGLNKGNGPGCFASVTGLRLSSFQIWGGGNGLVGQTHVNTIIQAFTDAFVDNVTIADWGAGDTALVAFGQAGMNLNELVVDGAGARGLVATDGGGACYGCFVGANSVNNIVVTSGSTEFCTSCETDGVGTGGVQILVSGTFLCTTCAGIPDETTGTIMLKVLAGGKATISTSDGPGYSESGVVGSTTFYANGGTISINGTTVTGGAVAAILVDAGGTINDLCGNTITGAITLTLGSYNGICDNGTNAVTLHPIRSGSNPPSVLPGTAGGHSMNEGTGPLPAAGVDTIYANAASHCATIQNNGIDQGCASTVVTQLCGTTVTCSQTVQVKPIIVYGKAPLSSGTPSTATLTALPFTSSTSYVCIGTDQTTATANLIKFANVSGSSTVITGPNTNTDVIGYVCVGI